MHNICYSIAGAVNSGLSVDQVPEPHFTGPIENITVAVGKEAILSCYVQNLGTYKVSEPERGRKNFQQTALLQTNIPNVNICRHKSYTIEKLYRFLMLPSFRPPTSSFTYF